MPNNFRTFSNGIRVEPKTTSTADRSGEIDFQTSDSKFVANNGSESSPVVLEGTEATLTNKTLESPVINTPSGITKSDVGLGNVDNTSDATKNAATATLTNKTITAPVINGGTLNGITISGVTGITKAEVGLGNVDNTSDSDKNSASATLTHKTINADDNTIQNIKNANIYFNANISYSKLAALNSEIVPVTTPDGAITSSDVTSTELEYLSGVNYNIQNQLDYKVDYTAFSNKGDLITATAASTPSALPTGSFGQVLTVDNTTSTGLKWSAPATGAKNYISNSNFESNSTTGWSLAHTTLSNLIPNQSSGSWSSASGNLSTSIISFGQLAGSYSLGLTSSSATTPGDMLVTDVMTIDKEDQSKILTFKFYYQAAVNPTNLNLSGTSANTYQVYIYDVTNSAWIQPTGAYGLTQGTGVGICTGTFQTTSNSTQYRLAIVCINASAGAHAIYVDDLSVGPQTAPIGAVITDWQAYTPTFVGFGTVTGVVFYSRRYGDSLQFRGQFTAGTSTAVQARIGLGFAAGAGNVVADSTKVGSGQIIGNAAITAAGSISDITVLASGGNSYVNLGVLSGASTDNTTPVNGNGIALAGTTIVVEGTVPIVGWSSNVQMSNDTDTRVIAMQAGLTSNQAVGAASVIKFDTVVSDVSAGYSTTTGLYTVPVSGYYSVSATVTINSASASIYAVKNGSSAGFYFCTVQSSVGLASGTITLKCNADDTIGIYSDSSGTFIGSNASGFVTSLNIQRLSGPAVIAATESVYASYGLTTSQAVSANAIIKNDTKIKDSHNSYSTSTGLYTIPVSGEYNVGGVFNTGSGGTFYLVINGSPGAYISGAASSFTSSGYTLVHFNAGDTVGLSVDTSGTFTGSPAPRFINLFNIYRIGN